MGWSGSMAWCLRKVTTFSSAFGRTLTSGITVGSDVLFSSSDSDCSSISSSIAS